MSTELSSKYKSYYKVLNLKCPNYASDYSTDQVKKSWLACKQFILSKESYNCLLYIHNKNLNPLYPNFPTFAIQKDTCDCEDSEDIEGLKDFISKDYEYFSNYTDTSMSMSAWSNNVEKNIYLTFEEAYFGCIKKIQVKVTECCKICEGDGCVVDTNDTNASIWNVWNIFTNKYIKCKECINGRATITKTIDVVVHPRSLNNTVRIDGTYTHIFVNFIILENKMNNWTINVTTGQLTYCLYLSYDQTLPNVKNSIKLLDNSLFFFESDKILKEGDILKFQNQGWSKFYPSQLRVIIHVKGDENKDKKKD